jgi:PKD repeat protein
MKKIIILSLLVSGLISCSKKDKPLVPDFDLIVSGESPTATIQIINKSSGADLYKWNFDKGASDSVSILENPSMISVDKAGEFIVKLTADNGSEKKTIEKKITVAGNSAILTFTNLEFGLEKGSLVYGRYFSFETGIMYKDAEINSTNGSKIDIGLGSFNQYMLFFASPDDHRFSFLLNIPNATLTKIVNWESNLRITPAAFDSMNDDRLLSALNIVDNNQSFDNEFPHTVLFQLSTLQKGVIKLKAVNSDRLLVDIKIQKY